MPRPHVSKQGTRKNQEKTTKSRKVSRYREASSNRREEEGNRSMQREERWRQGRRTAKMVSSNRDALNGRQRNTGKGGRGERGKEGDEGGATRGGDDEN